MEHYLSLKDHVYRYISDCINTGSLNPGDKINEAQVRSMKDGGAMRVMGAGR